jgi:hypothetical protein
MFGLFNPGKGERAFQTEVSADGKTPGMTLDEVMQTCQLDSIDLLKMDIEGGGKRSVRERLAGRSHWNPGD